TGGIPEIVEHKKNGYVAKYKDLDDLEKGLEYLLNLSDSEINLMSENSIEKIRNNFTEEIMIDNYIKLYNSLLKK
ncbi:MAG: glycosyl transferase, partial [Candidatus Nomurabacteria bacterium]|nr:glycosyl transferase [Candidatus Nomurabacteria bacterium]